MHSHGESWSTMIDLHTHSTFSDGSLPPSELVALAARSGVTQLALTDHDTTDGVCPFMAACDASLSDGSAVEGIPGVELSVDSKRGTMHMLGYCMDAQYAGLQDMLSRIRQGREERNQRILDKLRSLGAAMEWHDVAVLSSDGVVGRPHFAQALVKGGFVDSTQKAFSHYLGNRAPAYCERYRPGAEEAIRAIRDAGGVAVLAHPVTLDMKLGRLRSLLVELSELGLQGVEVYYSEHAPSLEGAFLGLTRDLGLIATGGSDFHGDLNPRIRLGRGFGQLRVPPGTVERLRALQG